jgi:hypothetical protein
VLLPLVGSVFFAITASCLILAGIAAGCFAGVAVKGAGFGLLGQRVAQVAGAFCGGYVFVVLLINAGIGTAMTVSLGAFVLLVSVWMLRRT